MNSQSAVINIEQPDWQTIKAKHKSTWEDGDYAAFAKYMENGAVDILDGWDIPADRTLLDVGCGSGQSAIPAAKKGIHVTGIDIAENLIEHARERAARSKLCVQFDVGDAEDLPYESEKFDVVISMIGAMFAPRPDRVTSEFSRVLKPGGKLYMANWTPSSMPAKLFKAAADVTPPPAGFIPPVLWGDEETVKQRLSNNFTDITLTRKIYPQWQYPFNARDLVDLFRTHFGPVKRAFDVADIQQKQQLQRTLENIYKDNSEYLNDILTITGGEYLEVIATRR